MACLDIRHIEGLKDPVYLESQSFLSGQPKFGRGVGLLRMRRVLRQLPFSQTWNAVKITGSNGKGSTLAMLSAIFHELELNHGTYSSPHLIYLNERICVDGQPVSNSDFAESIAWFKDFLADHLQQRSDDRYGGFEVITAVALHHFAAKRIPHLIIEAGIGGRFDSTRPIPGRLVALTSLDLEHTDLLGDSLEAVAYDKMDLCPPGGTLVLNRLSDDAPLEEIRAYAELLNIRLIETARECRVFDISTGPDHTRFSLTAGTLTISDVTMKLLGPRQLDNACLAVLLTREYLKMCDIQISDARFAEVVKKGLATANWLGRVQKVHDDPPIYLDVGHTPKAVAAFLEALPDLVGDSPILLVTGVSHNKAVEEIVDRLLPIASKVICTRAYHMGSEVTRIENVVKANRPDLPYRCAPTIEEAVQASVRLARDEHMTVVVAGGLFLSMEYLMALEGHNPRLLRFF